MKSAIFNYEEIHFKILKGQDANVVKKGAYHSKGHLSLFYGGGSFFFFQNINQNFVRNKFKW